MENEDSIENHKEAQKGPQPLSPSDYDENYLNSLINKAKSSWSDVGDADEWLRELRGGTD